MDDQHLSLDLSKSQEYEGLLSQLQALAEQLQQVDLLFQDKTRDKNG